MMDRKKGNNWKDLMIFGGFVISFSGLIMNNHYSSKRSQFAENQAVIKSHKEMQKVHEDINIKIALIKNESQKNHILSNSNNASLYRIRDQLALYSKKEEINEQILRQDYMFKTDMINVNGHILSLNKRLSYIEGALQYFFMQYHSLPAHNFYGNADQAVEPYKTIHHDQ